MIQSILEKLILNNTDKLYIEDGCGKGISQASQDIKAVILKELVEKMEGKKKPDEAIALTTMMSKDEAKILMAYNKGLSEAIEVVKEVLR